MYPNVHCRTVYDSQNMEATWMSINRWMDKDVVHVYSAIEALKIMGKNAICRNMDGPKDYHIKWIKSYRKKQIQISLIIGNLKNDINELI